MEQDEPITREQYDAAAHASYYSGVGGSGPVFSIIGGIIGFVVLIIAAGLAGDNYSCHQRATLMQFPVNWSVITGCMIKIDGRWQPIERLVIVR